MTFSCRCDKCFKSMGADDIGAILGTGETDEEFQAPIVEMWCSDCWAEHSDE